MKQSENTRYIFVTFCNKKNSINTNIESTQKRDNRKEQQVFKGSL